jgi:hypothetical protein
VPREWESVSTLQGELNPPSQIYTLTYMWHHLGYQNSNEQKGGDQASNSVEKAVFETRNKTPID